MTERQLRIRLNSLFTQLHFTVIYESDILRASTMQGLYDLRDRILDEIIFTERQIGIRK